MLYCLLVVSHTLRDENGECFRAMSKQTTITALLMNTCLYILIVWHIMLMLVIKYFFNMCVSCSFVCGAYFGKCQSDYGSWKTRLTYNNIQHPFQWMAYAHWIGGAGCYVLRRPVANCPTVQYRVGDESVQLQFKDSGNL